MAVTYPTYVYGCTSIPLTITPTVSNPLNVASYSVDTLPDGLTINTTTGVISGTPNLVDEYTTQVTALMTNATTIVNEIAITTFAAEYDDNDVFYGVHVGVLTGAPFPASFEFDTDINGAVLHDFTITPDLPDGFNLDTDTGTIYGTPTVAVDQTYTVSFKTNDDTVFSIPITLHGVYVSYGFIYNILVGESFSITPTIHSPVATIDNFEVLQDFIGPTPQLPPGVTLNPTTGVISGTCNEVFDPNFAPIFIAYGFPGLLFYTVIFLNVTTVSYGPILTIATDTEYTITPTFSSVLDPGEATNFRLETETTGVTVDPDTGVITITDEVDYQFLFMLKILYDTDYPDPGAYFMYTMNLPPECLHENTNILTPSGYKPIKSLNIGDFVVTENRLVKKIKYIHTTSYEGSLYKIPKKVFKQTTPFNDILITGKHKFKYDDRWHKPRTYFQKIKLNQPTTLYHIQLNDITQNIIAEGVVVESYHPPGSIEKHKKPFKY